MPRLLHHRLALQTAGSFCCHDITPELQAQIDRSGIRAERLLSDIHRFFLDLAPPLAVRSSRGGDLVQPEST
jgi:hypothetical protein